MCASSHQGGFSLVEMSIILTMFAVLMASLLSDTTQKRTEAAYMTTQNRMEKVADAIESYVRYHGHIPCPASLTTALSSATFGSSVVTCQTPATTVAGTTLINNASGASDQYQMIAGMIPVRELGLREQDAMDAWQRRITYVMIRPTGSYLGYRDYLPTQATDYPEIRNASNTLLSGSSASRLPAFILVSHGIDGKGGYTKAGALFSACGTAYDSENCDYTTANDKLVRISPLVTNVTETAATYYHDVVVWRSLIR
jgi:type II secretory pathway pseudopilin PulG